MYFYTIVLILLLKKKTFTSVENLSTFSTTGCNRLLPKTDKWEPCFRAQYVTYAMAAPGRISMRLLVFVDYIWIVWQQTYMLFSFPVYRQAVFISLQHHLPCSFCLHCLLPLLGSILPYVLPHIWVFYQPQYNAQLEYLSTEASGVAMLTNTACMNYLIPCVAAFVCLVAAMPFCVFVCGCVYPGRSTHESYQLCSQLLLLGGYFFFKRYSI